MFAKWYVALGTGGSHQSDDRRGESGRWWCGGGDDRLVVSHDGRAGGSGRGGDRGGARDRGVIVRRETVPIDPFQQTNERDDDDNKKKKNTTGVVKHAAIHRQILRKKIHCGYSNK